MKRRGIIAVLAGLVAGVQKSKGQDTRISGIQLEYQQLTWMLQKGPVEKTDLYNCKNRPSDNGIFAYQDCQKFIVEEPPFAIEVIYGDRTVRLTAKEVMDALEGK